MFLIQKKKYAYTTSQVVCYNLFELYCESGYVFTDKSFFNGQS